MSETFTEINTYFPWFFPMVAAIFGACVGSFLNVVIYRVPAGRSVVHPGSTCACGKPIAWYDNIPILTWFFLRGKARCCGARFSFRYPAVEMLVAFLFWAAWMHYTPLAALAVMVAIGLLISGAFIDLDTMELPDAFTVGGFLAGVVLSALIPSLHGIGGHHPLIDGMRSVLVSLQGAFIGSGLILWFALVAELVLRKEAMGMGDVLLQGAIGAFFGWQGAIFSLFGGAVVGLVVIYPLIKLTGHQPKPPVRPDEEAKSESSESEEEEAPTGHVPFGPGLVGGALLYALWLQPMVDRHFQEFAEVLFSS